MRDMRSRCDRTPKGISRVMPRAPKLCMAWSTTSDAISVANTFTIDASVRMSSPRSALRAASCTSKRVRWILVAEVLDAQLVGAQAPEHRDLPLDLEPRRVAVDDEGGDAAPRAERRVGD